MSVVWKILAGKQDVGGWRHDTSIFLLEAFAFVSKIFAPVKGTRLAAIHRVAVIQKVNRGYSWSTSSDAGCGEHITSVVIDQHLHIGSADLPGCQRTWSHNSFFLMHIRRGSIEQRVILSSARPKNGRCVWKVVNFFRHTHKTHTHTHTHLEIHEVMMDRTSIIMVFLGRAWE